MVTDMNMEQSLLDLIAIQMKCTYLSDLKFLTAAQRMRLANKLRLLAPQEKDLDQWNDALEYLTGAQAEPEAHMAKARLIQLLSEPYAAGEFIEGGR